MPDPVTTDRPTLPAPFAECFELMTTGRRHEAVEAFGFAAEPLGPLGYIMALRTFSAAMLDRGTHPDAVEAFEELAIIWGLMELPEAWVRDHPFLSAAMH